MGEGIEGVLAYPLAHDAGEVGSTRTHLLQSETEEQEGRDRCGGSGPALLGRLARVGRSPGEQGAFSPFLLFFCSFLFTENALQYFSCQKDSVKCWTWPHNYIEIVGTTTRRF